MKLVKDDVRTTTGSNLRSIMLLAGKSTLGEVLDSKGDIEYHKMTEEELWRPNLLKEIIDVLNDEKTVAMIDNDELEDILKFLCTA